MTCEHSADCLAKCQGLIFLPNHVLLDDSAEYYYTLCVLCTYVYYYSNKFIIQYLTIDTMQLYPLCDTLMFAGST